MDSFLMNWTPRVLSILRIIAGFLFLWHGSQKLFGFPPSGQPGDGSLPPLILVAGILEFFGGLLLQPRNTPKTLKKTGKVSRYQRISRSKLDCFYFKS